MKFEDLPISREEIDFLLTFNSLAHQISPREMHRLSLILQSHSLVVVFSQFDSGNAVIINPVDCLYVYGDEYLQNNPGSRFFRRLAVMGDMGIDFRGFDRLYGYLGWFANTSRHRVLLRTCEFI